MPWVFPTYIRLEATAPAYQVRSITPRHLDSANIRGSDEQQRVSRTRNIHGPRRHRFRGSRIHVPRRSVPAISLDRRSDQKD